MTLPPHLRDEEGHTCELHCKTSAGKPSEVYWAHAVAAMYCNDSSGVKQLVTTIGLQYDLAAVICHPIDVRKSPSSYRVFADKIDVLWVKPMTGSG